MKRTDLWPGAWIGVDFDRTLATGVTWDLETMTLPLGEPIPAMVERVKEWLAQGVKVRIFTARVGACGATNQHGVRDDAEWASGQRRAIMAWCQKHIGCILEVTATKDLNMAELWDDRAVTVEADTGRVLIAGKE